MLVLSRQHNQQILIGDNIVITVVEIRGGKVRIGIKAPEHINIVRSELVQTDGQLNQIESAE